MFIMRKYVKFSVKKRESPSFISVLEVERSKILQKLNIQEFFMAFLAQKLTYTINL